jgi:phage gpG-like protein
MFSIDQAQKNMSDKITIEIDSAPVLDALNRLAAGVGPAGMRAPLTEIGEYLAESTRRRFVTSTAPDGSRWAPNAQATYLGMLSRKDSRKDGRIGARGAAKAMNKRPLVESGLLAEQIVFQLLPDGSGVEVGTNRFADLPGVAAVHQFGSRDGKIPARPFLGLSAADEEKVLGILDRYLAGLMGA